MNEPDITDILKEFSHLPHFDDGRINYADAIKAPVLVCFVKYVDEFLLLKRSEKVHAYKNLWSCVAGFIDEERPLSEKVIEELSEELGMSPSIITSMKWGTPYSHTDAGSNKTWVRHPVLVSLSEKPIIKLDFEHSDYAWVKENDLRNYQTTPGLLDSLRRIV